MVILSSKIVFLLIIAGVLIPLFIITELPAILSTLPVWMLKILCFVPFGITIFLAIQVVNTGNQKVLFIVLPGACLCLYAGFVFKNNIDR